MKISGKKTIYGLTMLVFAGLLLSSCKSITYQIDRAVINGQYDEAVKLHEKNKKKLYNKKSIILYQLDSGMLNFYAGNNDPSIQLLQDAEYSIEEAYTKSITEGIGMVLANHKSQSYAGEDYEDLYINAFNALSYNRKDQNESAMVEVRRMSEKLAFINAKYEVIAAALENKERKSRKTRRALKDTERLGVVLTLRRYNYRIALNDSVLGRYMGMLFYRNAGKYDDVRIDYEAIGNIFSSEARLYNFPIPSAVKNELDVSPHEARLNVMSFSGLSPIKGEDVLEMRFDNDLKVTYSIPKLVYRPSAVSRVEIVFDDGETYRMELLENIELVQGELMRFKLEEIMKATRARVLAKAIPAQVAYGVGKSLLKGGVTAVVGLPIWGAGMIGAIYITSTERADTRASRYFPGKVHISGIGLEPGTYSFKVNYYDTEGTVITSVPFNDVPLTAGRLNLVEAFCLK